MSDEIATSAKLSLLAQVMRSETPTKGYIESAQRHLDTVGIDQIRGELGTYLDFLYATSGPRIQVKPAEGPEDYGTLLAANEELKRYKARIAKIGFDASFFAREATRMIDMVKTYLMLRKEYHELKNAQEKEAALKLVARELFEVKEIFELIEDKSKLVNREYSDYFNANSLDYNLINAMSYYRGLYPADGPKPNQANTTRRA